MPYSGDFLKTSTSRNSIIYVQWICMWMHFKIHIKYRTMCTQCTYSTLCKYSKSSNSADSNSADSNSSESNSADSNSVESNSVVPNSVDSKIIWTSYSIIQTLNSADSKTISLLHFSRIVMLIINSHILWEFLTFWSYYKTWEIDLIMLNMDSLPYNTDLEQCKIFLGTEMCTFRGPTVVYCYTSSKRTNTLHVVVQV